MEHQPETERRWYQYGVKSLLVLTALVAVTLSMLARSGTVAALLVGLVAVAILLVSACTGNRRPWLIGLVFVLALVAALTPPDPFGTALVAVPACLVYLLGVAAWNAVRKARSE